jgi:hypothetical protein
LGLENGYAPTPKEGKEKTEQELRDRKTSLLLNKSFFTEVDVE